MVEKNAYITCSQLSKYATLGSYKSPYGGDRELNMQKTRCCHKKAQKVSESSLHTNIFIKMSHAICIGRNCTKKHAKNWTETEEEDEREK